MLGKIERCNIPITLQQSYLRKPKMQKFKLHVIKETRQKMDFRRVCKSAKSDY